MAEMYVAPLLLDEPALIDDVIVNSGVIDEGSGPEITRPTYGQ